MAADGTETADGLRAWVSARLSAERERWVLWLPVALGAGIGLYFALPFEPLRILGIVLLVAGVAAAALMWRVWALRIVAVAILAMTLGFALAQWRTHDVAAPVLERTLNATAVTGQVLSVEPGVRGPRVVLAVEAIARLDGKPVPERIRLRLHGDDTDIRPGARIRVRARLAPPPSASYPGAYDFSRQAWYARLGAVGFAFGPAERLESTISPGLWGRLNGLVEGARTSIAQRISTGIDKPAGAVAAALATGLRGEIPEEVRAQMRDSGLAHLLAISGLHIGLVAGFVFALVRGGLALVPSLALRWPLKQIAAVAALIAAAVYMLLAGATVPTQRAFVMTAIVLLAVLVNRTGISLRLIAVAASVVLLLRPEALLSVSFQMSFAAAIALVAAYEAFAG
ncbi:MAG: ComEC/Rec2 family competence protein, partial [Alphaproteobacteria bacterium]|nr:ComEC/Rec2 family competence protein [Alphaproteobacteria bacterium]